MTTCIKVTCHLPAWLLTWPLLTTILVQFTSCSTHEERNAPTVLRYYVAPGSELYHFMSGRVAPFRVGGCPRYIGGKLSPCAPSPVLLQKLDVRCAPSVEPHGRATQGIVVDNVFWGDVEPRHRQGFLQFWHICPKQHPCQSDSVATKRSIQMYLYRWFWIYLVDILSAEIPHHAYVACVTYLPWL